MVFKETKIKNIKITDAKPSVNELTLKSFLETELYFKR